MLKLLGALSVLIIISSSSVLDKDTVLQHHFVWLNSLKLYLQYLHVCYFYLDHHKQWPTKIREFFQAGDPHRL